jgi:hypothetical protein
MKCDLERLWIDWSGVVIRLRRIQAWCSMNFEEAPGHVFARFGVEIRTVAARMALRRLRQLHPSFEAWV